MEIRNMSIRLQLNAKEMIHAFRDCILEKRYPEKTIAFYMHFDLSFQYLESECERRFS